MRAIFLLLEIVLPALVCIGIGVAGTLGTQRWLRRKQRIAAQAASRDRRAASLAAASKDELLDELTKRDLYEPRVDFDEILNDTAEDMERNGRA